MLRRKYSQLHRFAAIALALWLSGVSCLLCCGTLATADVTTVTDDCSMIQAESCGMDGAGDGCCSEPSEQSDENPCQKECCILDAPLADLPLAPQLIQSPATLPVATWRFVLPDKLTELSFTTRRFHLPDQRETYLRCCVFLI
jgi:hypothetical protein